MTHVVWQSSSVAWIVTAGVVLAGLHAVISYGRLRAMLRPTWLRILMGLRLAALALLALAAFQPSLSFREPSSVKHRVVIMLDTSRSMGVVDSARTPGELLRLAVASGGLDPSIRARPMQSLLTKLRDLLEQVRSLRAADEAISQAKVIGPVDESLVQRASDALSKTRGGVTSAIAQAKSHESTTWAEQRLTQIQQLLLEAVQRQQAQRQLELLVRETERRDDAADDALAKSDARAKQAVDQLQGKSRLDLAKQAVTRLAADLQQQANPVWQTLDEPLKPESLGGMSATMPRSPILQSLRQVVERSSGRDLEAIILLSDGRSTEPRTSIPPLLTASGVPVFTVQAAPSVHQPDVRLVRVEAPPTALASEQIAVRVHLRQRGAEGKQVKVTLTDGVATQTRTVTLNNTEEPIDFDWPALKAPGADLKASVERLPNESSADNNEASVHVAVTEQKLHVALIAGSASWDLQYLRNILARTPWVELQDQIIAPGETCKLTPDVLSKQDVFVLADVPIAALSPQQIDAMHRAVVDGSRSVLLLGNDPDVLKAYANHPLLSAFLPYRVDQTPVWRQTPADEAPILPVPTRQAATLPMLRLEDSPDATIRKWLTRPRLFRSLNIGQLKPQAAPLLIDRASQAPLMVESAAGLGRSLMMLIDETWRWRRDIGGEAHDRFWLQVVRHLVDPPYAATKDALSIGLDRSTVVAEQSVEVRARAPSKTDTPATFELRRDGQVIETQPARELIPGAGRFAGKFSPSAAGSYEIAFKQGDKEVSTSLSVTPADEIELADLTPDSALLRRIAESTGGAAVNIDDVAELAKRVLARRSEKVGTIQYAIWCSPYLFGLLVGCLGLEWAIRKQLGLV